MATLKQTVSAPQIAENAVVKVTTSGERGQIRTIASVTYIEQHDGYSTESFTMFADFQKTLKTTTVGRATKKAIRAQHEDQMKDIDSIIAMAEEHYKD